MCPQTPHRPASRIDEPACTSDRLIWGHMDITLVLRRASDPVCAGEHECLVDKARRVRGPVEVPGVRREETEFLHLRLQIRLADAPLPNLAPVSVRPLAVGIPLLDAIEQLDIIRPRRHRL